MPPPFDFDWFHRREDAAAEQFDKAQWHVAAEHTKFFETLGLLSAGAVVLSISLLTSMLGKNSVIHAMVLLFAGWFSFIAALLASLFRAVPYQKYTINTFLGWYNNALAEKKQYLAALAKTGPTAVVAPPTKDSPARPKRASELTQEADQAGNQALWGFARN